MILDGELVGELVSGDDGALRDGIYAVHLGCTHLRESMPMLPCSQYLLCGFSDDVTYDGSYLSEVVVMQSIDNGDLKVIALTSSRVEYRVHEV